jgi:hypothetical protein
MTPYTHHEISKIHQAECRHERQAIREAKRARLAENGDISVFQRWTTAIRLQVSSAKMTGAGMAERTRLHHKRHTVHVPVKHV